MKTNQTVLKLSIIIIILAIIAAGAGVLGQGQGDTVPFTTFRGESVTLFGHGLYQYDTVSYVAQAVAQDVVTLILGIPLLIAGVVLTGKGSLRGQLLLTGTLGYFLYTYTSYTFLLTFNPLFLLYVTLFSLLLFTFILAMMDIHPEKIAVQFSDKYPRKAVSVFMMILAGFLTMAWLGRIVPATLGGSTPIGLESYTTLVIQALDLGIIVPVSAMAGILLWRGRPWGYALSSIVLVKGLTMGAALVAMMIGMLRAGVPANMVEIVMFSGIALAALIFTLILFKNVNEPVKG